MKKLIIALSLFLSGGVASATPLCGGPSVMGFDVGGDWSYTWQDRGPPDPPDFLHGTMHLVTCNGFVTGYMGVPVEFTDPGLIASWNQPVLGTENGSAVMLMTANPGGTPWFFELQQNTLAGTMSGETYAGAGHTDRGVIFTANNFSGFGHRFQVQGQPMTCPAGTLGYAGTFHYQWGTGWSGTMTLNQSGSYFLGSMGLPVEVSDPWLITHWFWPFVGGMITPADRLRIMAIGGTGFGDPWLFSLPRTSVSPLTFSGTVATGGGAYATSCFTRAADMTITRDH